MSICTTNANHVYHPSPTAGFYDEVVARSARTLYELRTGGKATFAPAASLFVLSASAEGVGEPFWWETDQNKKAYSISSDKIVLGSLGQLGSDGKLYIALPNQKAFDVTPTVEGNPYYTYSKPAVSKHRLVHQTQCAALTDSNLERTTLGVGEYVNFSFDPPFQMTSPEQPLWGTSDGSVSPDIGTCTTFTAPSNAAASVVHVSVREAQLDTTFAILEPFGVKAWYSVLYRYPLGQAAAKMTVDVWVTPTAVSFCRVELCEIPGPATAIRGYFTNYPPQNLAHTTAGDFWPLNQNNWFFDDCWWIDSHVAPFQDGGFTWDIPVKWRIPGGHTNDMGRWLQHVTIDPAGTVSVSKFDLTVLRTTNDNITTSP